MNWRTDGIAVGVTSRSWKKLCDNLLHKKYGTCEKIIWTQQRFFEEWFDQFYETTNQVLRFHKFDSQDQIYSSTKLRNLLLPILIN